ncbi:hypothetical protein [Thermoactinospora rubra]|uniref:hypothetical protein n=1 Tax=Thermoactinospora rubra TaxID=1088767 RepID=UPI000A104562|nr:hypothetical protein [Thermoactinospora rubra]
MTYRPLWPEWSSKTRDVIDQFMEALNDEGRAAVGGLADFVGEQIRQEFPDLDHGIVGWITMRACSHLGALANQSSAIDAETLAMVGLLAGQSIEAGEA